MGKLIYSMITSVDGHVENEQGGLDWAPSEELNSYVNQRMSSVGAYLYGRRMYEAIVFGRRRTRFPICRTSCATGGGSGR